ncbi:MAG: cyclic pyranopterin monophosphate synthase MoaC [Nitrospirae bacterium]|nr:MAG: cyclic pyranopterin monophosphate synthase MoaC [Nitrospirota bacterium]
MKQLTHIDKKGRPKMVDVSAKQTTKREAVAGAHIYMKKKTFEMVKKGKVSKGDVLSVAKVAGIMAAKKTSEIIPLCHPLNITFVDIDFTLDAEKNRIGIKSRVKITGQTGVEMEALTAVAAAALTIYDMCKAVDKTIIISDIMLMEKSGGKSGRFKRKR